MIQKEKLSNKKKQMILSRLNKTLTVENATIIALAGYGIIAYSILVVALNIQALLYSFYLIKSLYFLKKTKWIIAFFIMVFSPWLISIIWNEGIFASTITGSISLFMFYLFCWILKFYVAQWLEDVKYENIDFSK